MKKPGSRMTFVIGLLAGALGMSVLGAQQPPPAKRTVLLKKDMQIPGREAVMNLVELAPGGSEGRHTHPAETFVYIVDGSIAFEQEGRPSTTYKTGDAFAIEPGKIHDGKNVGTAPSKVLVVFIAEKGKPLRTDVQ